MNHFDNTKKLISDIVKNGDMQLLMVQIRELNDEHEKTMISIDVLEQDKIDGKPHPFLEFQKLQLHLINVQLDMLMDRQCRFQKK